ncbi:MAG: hypothetical protein MI723_08260 [Caulobacterales bacterium]|nr:hypothetical protein [Caulobacterales bacterium]
MRVFVVIKSMLVLVAAPVPAQSPPLEAFAASPQVQDAALSPDGNRIAVLMTLPDGERVVRVFEYGDGGFEDVGAMFVGDIKARSIDWANNTYLLLWVSEKTRIANFRECEPETRVEAMRAMHAFLAEHLGPGATAP